MLRRKAYLRSPTSDYGRVKGAVYSNSWSCCRLNFAPRQKRKSNLNRCVHDFSVRVRWATHTHTHTAHVMVCICVYNNLCIISLLWLRCCTMPKPTKSLQNSHSQCMQGPLLRTTFCHVFRVCIQWITGKCCDSQEGLEVENHSPENIYRLKTVVSSHGSVWRWMNAMTCDVLLFFHFFGSNICCKSSELGFFCFPQNPCYPFIGSQKKGVRIHDFTIRPL